MAASAIPTDRYAIKCMPMEQFYLNENLADFHFIFKSKSSDGHSERIPVHKIVLANVSDVFRVMFNGSWKEKVDVAIVDASADAFKEFLQFFYLSEANVTSQNAGEVMNLGKMYDVTECFDVCGQFLMAHITDDDVCVIYGLASHLEHEELEKQCVEYIQRNAKAILTSESFLECDPKVLQKILQMDWLACPEVEVFEALVKWMIAKMEPAELTQQIVQSQFNELWKEIRFGSMTLGEFASVDSVYSALFTIAEHSEIIQMIYSEQFQPKIFKANHRNSFGPIDWNENAVILCYRNVESSSTPYFIKNIETTTFTVNKPVALGTFNCYPICLFQNGHFDVVPEMLCACKITIFEIPDPTNSNRKVTLHKEKLLMTKYVKLAKPIVIRPERKYEIQIKFELPSAGKWCINGKCKQEVHMPPDITVKFYNDPIVENEARGLIRTLLFYKIWTCSDIN